MTDSKLVFPLCDSNPLLWAAWKRDVTRISQTTERTIRNDENQRETVNFYIMVIMGLRWSFAHEFWAAAVADLGLLTTEAIAEHCPRLLPGELLNIEEDIDSYHMRNRRIHRSMQVAIRQAVMAATTQLPFSYQIQSFDQSMEDSDLYQGSRLIAHLMDLMHTFVRNAPTTYMPQACDLTLQFKMRPDMENSEVHELVSNLGNHIELLNFSGSIGAEQEVMRLVVQYLEDPSRVVFATIAREIRDNPTFANFRAAIIRFIPLDLSTIHMTAQIQVTQSLNTPVIRRLKDKVNRKYTPEQQEEHIKKLHMERKLAKQEIERLIQEIERLRRESQGKEGVKI